MRPPDAPGALFGTLFGRLGFRLMAAVGLALLPLAVLAYVQAAQFQREATARIEAALFGETLLAAAPHVNAIMQARGVAAALAAAVEPVTGDAMACIDILGRFVRSQTLITFAGYIPVDGRMTCASTGTSHDFSQDPRLIDLVANPRPLLTVNAKGAITGESVLIFNQPVVTEDDTLLGFVALSLPHRALRHTRVTNPAGGTVRDPLALVTFDATGTVLTGIYDLATVHDRLPRGRNLADFAGAAATTFTGETEAGDRRTFAVLPIEPDTLYILASWPPPASLASAFGDRIPLWAFPSAMWLASLVVAWLVAEHQVLRHVRTLREAITAFAGGSRSVDPPELDQAPTELRDVGEAYEQLVDSVLHDEAALEDTIHQKEVLLREVHHRVKNNLQLIASIMNIQMRRATSDEAKALVKGLHDRVMSLSTVHRELYQTTGLTDVKADELLSTIATQVLRMGASPARSVDLTTRIDPIRLTPDQSVPLSLLLTEALTNVLKHAGAGSGQRIALTIAFTRLPEGRARLQIVNSLPDPSQDVTRPPRVDSTAMGEQLLNAFALQLGGMLTVAPGPASYAVAIEFPVRALSEAEERFAAG